MPRTFEFPLPIKIDRLTRIMKFRGVNVYIHWSVFAIAIVMVINAIHRPFLVVAGLLSYFGVLLLHECGHLVAAHKLHCEVYEISLYPIFGIVRFQIPWSRLDHCLIAWAGVLAQFAVAIPLVLLTARFGYTRFEPVNAVLGIWGPFSLLVAVFNLLPMKPLDGSVALGLLPALIRRNRIRKI